MASICLKIKIACWYSAFQTSPFVSMFDYIIHYIIVYIYVYSTWSQYIPLFIIPIHQGIKNIPVYLHPISTIPWSPFDPPAPHEFRLGAPHPWIPCNPCWLWRRVTVWRVRRFTGGESCGCGTRATWVHLVNWMRFFTIRKSLIGRNPSQMFPSWAPILHPTKKIEHSGAKLFFSIWWWFPLSTRDIWVQIPSWQCHVTSCGSNHHMPWQPKIFSLTLKSRKKATSISIFYCYILIFV